MWKTLNLNRGNSTPCFLLVAQQNLVKRQNKASVADDVVLIFSRLLVSRRGDENVSANNGALNNFLGKRRRVAGFPRKNVNERIENQPLCRYAAILLLMSCLLVVLLIFLFCF